MTLETDDKEAAAVARAPRVALADIEAKIAARYDWNVNDVLGALALPPNDSLRVLSICVLVLRNGFTIIGKSAPASPDNFNPDLGRKFAYEDALRQIWPLEGYLLRDSLSKRPTIAHAAHDAAKRDEAEAKIEEGKRAAQEEAEREARRQAQEEAGRAAQVEAQRRIERARSDAKLKADREAELKVEADKAEQARIDAAAAQDAKRKADADHWEVGSNKKGADDAKPKGKA